MMVQTKERGSDSTGYNPVVNDHLLREQVYPQNHGLCAFFGVVLQIIGELYPVYVD